MAVAPESWCWIQAEGSKFKLKEESGPLKIWLWPNGCLQSLRMFSFISLSYLRYFLNVQIDISIYYSTLIESLIQITIVNHLKLKMTILLNLFDSGLH